MKITVIGAGHAGTTIAADLSLRGHDVTLLKTSQKLHNDHFSAIMESGKILINENGETQTASVSATTDMVHAIPGRDLLIVFIQTNYHEELIKRISTCIEDGQTILIEPGYLSTCFFLQYCDKDITVIEAESSPIDCRIGSPGSVDVLFRNVLNPMGVFPKRNLGKAKKVLDLLGFPYRFTSSVVEAALNNPNLIVHTIGAIFSIPRIEYVQEHGGRYSMYREVFTPHIWNLVEALDREKMEVLERLKCEALPYVEACKERNSTDNEVDAKAVFFDYARNSSPFGPSVPDSRYVTEDVPQGLVLLESLGQVLHIATPICSGLINCASALLERDFRAGGRTVEQLTKNAIRTILEDSEA